MEILFFIILILCITAIIIVPKIFVKSNAIQPVQKKESLTDREIWELQKENEDLKKDLTTKKGTLQKLKIVIFILAIACLFFFIIALAMYSI